MTSTHRNIRRSNPLHTATVTLYLAPRSPLPPAHEIGSLPLAARHYLSRGQFAETHGAHPDHIAAVKTFASDKGLTLGAVDQGRGTVQLSGTLQALERAFEVELHDHSANEDGYRTVSRSPVLPEALRPIVLGVFGLDTRPVAHSRARRGGVLSADHSGVARRPAPTTDTDTTTAAPAPMTPVQVARLYNFPTGLTGAGQTIALIELGGGYSSSGVASYFASLGVSPAPEVQWISVDGAQNVTGSSADTEVQLDIEVAGAVAPGASICVYFAPNTDQGFIDAVSYALHDATNNPSIISISWGAAESGWSSSTMTSMDSVFQSAATLGVTIFVASGDHGSADSTSSANVDFPASSPNCTACGGTTLIGSGSTISSETVWNDNNGSATGGGVSAFFNTLPAYQQASKVPLCSSTQTAGRGVPDVAGNADPTTGYIVLIDGQTQYIGGTSAAAPLWAGLTALLNQSLGKPLGFLNSALYGSVHGADAIHDITSGNNSTDGVTTQWRAAAGWDPCTGLGSPNGAAILTALKA